jgi:arylsulfatase A-like enzyme
VVGEGAAVNAPRRWLPVGLASLAAALCACGEAAPPRRIVLIVIDTLRRDHVSAYGDRAATPHIDALAARGRALDAYASFHQTTMSMGALFTGRTPSLSSDDPARPLAFEPAAWCGMGRFVAELRPGECIPPTLPTLGEAMRARGYRSVGVVANALLFRPAGFDRGFERWVEVGDPEAKRPRQAARTRTWEHVNRAVREALAGVGDEPLFLYVHYLDVHDFGALRLDYAGAVAQVDAGVGDLLALLEEKGLLADAAIALVSDHGEALGETHLLQSLPSHFGNPSFRSVIEVPFILVGAPDLPLPRFLRSTDIHDALLQLAGAPPPRAGQLAEDELLLTELQFLTYQRGRFKSFWRRGADAAGLALVDLEADPGETRDVAAQHREVAEAHRRRMQALSRELAAPQLESAPADAALQDRLRALGYIE